MEFFITTYTKVDVVIAYVSHCVYVSTYAYTQMLFIQIYFAV